MTRKAKPLEAVSGSYTPIPHIVLDSAAFLGASHRAKSMLFELLRQHNGRNNGRLQLTSIWLHGRGWKSGDQRQKAKDELLARGLVVKTRLGGLRMGADWYALTWLPISDFTGLEMRPGGYEQGKWRLMDALPRPKKFAAQTATRNTPTPPHGTSALPAVPQDGTLAPSPTLSSGPPYGNNECCQFPPLKKRSRAVGAKGRSGCKTPRARPGSQPDTTGAQDATPPAPYSPELCNQPSTEIAAGAKG